MRHVHCLPAIAPTETEVGVDIPVACTQQQINDCLVLIEDFVPIGQRKIVVL